MSGAHDKHRRFVFGDFVIDYDRGSLTRDGVDIQLRPKSFAVLSHLAANSGRLVTKSELMEALWGQVIVTDGSLTQCIIDVRRALGPDGRNIIRTVPRRGFVFEVPMGGSAGEHVGSTADATALPRQPFRREWRLGRSLVLFCALVAIAGLGAVRMRPAAAPESPSAQAAAQEQYILGRHLYHRRDPGDVAAAVRYFERAVEMDPRHALAWTALAGALAVQSVEAYGGRDNRVADQWHAIRTALALDPDLAEAHVRHARLLRESGDCEGAKAALERAYALAPDDPLVLSTKASGAAREGRLDEAIAVLERLVRIEPLSALYRNNLARMLLTGGRIRAALDELQVAKQLQGDEGYEFDIAQALVLLGSAEEARRYWRDIEDPLWRDQIAVLIDEPQQAEGALLRLQGEGSPDAEILLAEIAAFHEDRQRAFAHIESAVGSTLEQGGGRRSLILADWLEHSPFLRHLRDDQRWDHLVAELLVSCARCRV